MVAVLVVLAGGSTFALASTGGFAAQEGTPTEEPTDGAQVQNVTVENLTLANVVVRNVTIDELTVETLEREGETVEDATFSNVTLTNLVLENVTLTDLESTNASVVGQVFGLQNATANETDGNQTATAPPNQSLVIQNLHVEQFTVETLTVEESMLGGQADRMAGNETTPQNESDEGAVEGAVEDVQRSIDEFISGLTGEDQQGQTVENLTVRELAVQQLTVQCLCEYRLEPAENGTDGGEADVTGEQVIQTMSVGSMEIVNASSQNATAAEQPSELDGEAGETPGEGTPTPETPEDATPEAEETTQPGG